MASRISLARNIKLAGFAVAAMMAASTAGQAQSPAEFYKGKTVNLLIGYSAGGGYDLYARTLARHIGKHIPGNPTVVAQNMPGAGSLKVVNYLFQVAPKDGTAFGTFARGMPLFPLLIGPADFDGTKLGYIGSITTDTSVCISWHDSPVKTWNDVLTKEYKAGGEGRGADPDMFATVLRTIFGAKTKLISGYPGTAEMTLAMERGELDGLCGISYSTLQSVHKKWLEEKKINVLVQAAVHKHPAIADVPSMLDIVKDPDKKAVVELIVAPQDMARPFATPPGVPQDRLEALRDAFDKTMKDPEFLADAKRLNLDVGPIQGKEIQELMVKLWASPKEIVDAAATAMGSTRTSAK